MLVIIVSFSAEDQWTPVTAEKRTDNQSRTRTILIKTVASYENISSAALKVLPIGFRALLVTSGCTE